MQASENSWFMRKCALPSAMAGVIFLLVGLFDKGSSWRGILPFSPSVLWLIIPSNSRTLNPIRLNLCASRVQGVFGCALSSLFNLL